MYVYGESKSHSCPDQDGCGVTNLKIVSDGPHVEDKENVGFGIGKETERIQSRGGGGGGGGGKLSQRTVLADVTHQFVSHESRTGESASGSAHGHDGVKAPVAAGVLVAERQAAANLRRMR